MSQTPNWLVWARELQAVAQTGLNYAHDDYDRQHFSRVGEIAAEIVAAQANIPVQDVQAGFALQLGYATPKIDVRAAAFSEGRVLLVQDACDKGWCLPGGWAEVGTPPSSTAVREVHEESGFEVEARKVIGVYDTHRTDEEPTEFYHAYKIVFLCEIVGGQAKASDETDAVHFFSLDDLPPLSESRTTTRHLQDAWACLKDPQRPTAFD